MPDISVTSSASQAAVVEKPKDDTTSEFGKRSRERAFTGGNGEDLLKRSKEVRYISL